MNYLDTSFLVGAITRELRTDDILAWLDEHGSERLFISDWTITEVASALSAKVRTGQQTPEQRAKSAAAFDQLQKHSLIVLPVQRSHFRRAAEFAERHELNIRSGDALHLAMAASANAIMITSDTRMAAAGPVLGVSTHMLSLATGHG
jgi:uncharacterized protein